MEDLTRPAPPPRSRQQRPRGSDRSLVSNPTRARWTTPERLRRRFTLNHSDGRGQLRRDGAEIDFLADDGAHAISGTVTGAAVVRPWAPWVALLLMLGAVIGTVVGTGLWLHPSDSRMPDVALGIIIWVMYAYEHVRTPFVRIDGIDDAGGPLVLHVHIKPSNPFRPAAEADALAKALRSAAHEEWMSRSQREATGADHGAP